jgi:FKBP-type peptidyl-prolyl cis-trans isomerase FkpA
VALRVLLLSCCFIPLGLLFSGCNNSTPEEGHPSANMSPMANSGITSLQVQDITPGAGAEARKGQTVRVHYTGWLYDLSKPDKRGNKFDSSKDRNEPFEFRLGAGEVIAGWDEGVAGMKVGGTRVLTIPPAMGYGARGAGGLIPPNATLLFEVELLGLQ